MFIFDTGRGPHPIYTHVYVKFVFPTCCKHSICLQNMNLCAYVYIYICITPRNWLWVHYGDVSLKQEVFVFFSWTTNKDNLLFRMFAPHVMNLKGACCDPVELSKAFCWAAMHPWAKWMPTDWMWSGNPEMSRLMLRHGILQVLEEGCLKKVPMEVDIFELEVGTTGEWYCWLKVLYTCITWEVLYPVHWCGLIAS